MDTAQRLAALEERLSLLESAFESPWYEADDPSVFNSHLDEYLYLCADAADASWEGDRRQAFLFLDPIAVERSDLINQSTFVYLTTLAGAIVEVKTDAAHRPQSCQVSYRKRDEREALLECWQIVQSGQRL